MALTERERRSLQDLARDLELDDARLARALTGSCASVRLREHWLVAALGLVASLVALILIGAAVLTGQAVPAGIGGLVLSATPLCLVWIWHDP